jgi:hypothetical protein
MTHLADFTFLSIIAALYMAAGVSLLVAIDIVRTHRHWPYPSVRMRWDRHGLIDILIGATYAAGDQLIRLGMLSH